MLTLLKKMFGRNPAAPAKAIPPAAQPRAAVPRAVPVAVPTAVASPAGPAALASENVAAPRPQVAVAQLSLAAIIGKMPADLRKNVVNMPADSVTVALPMATIHKQLPGGSVKMSLASLYRQAPPGTFTQVKTEEKRMVEVPLSEVFRHVDAQALRRRGDQRKVDLRGAPQLFGDKSNPYAIAPIHDDEELADEAVEDSYEELVADEELAAPPALPRFQLSEDGPSLAPAAKTPVSPGFASAPVAPVAPGAVSVPLQSLSDQWPEEIRAELESMPEASVVLPAERVAAGLSKGRVAFAWGELHAWIHPPPAAASEVAAETELVLPLKVIAPIFLAHSRPAARRKTAELDESIPALFGGGPPAAVPPPVEAPVETPAEPAPPAPDAPLAFRLAPPAELAPESAPAPAHAELQDHPPVAPAPASRTIGELFGEPGKTQWSAHDIIARSAKLPGVAGTVLALQEGLLVAAHLPPEMKGDTFAAFLPQIFARLNHYMGEMSLSVVEDILLTTNGAHLQAYRLGEVYFAVLGQPGASLPWEELRLVVNELASQAPK